MRVHVSFLIVTVVAIFTASCTAQKIDPQAEYKAFASIQDIMDSEIEPSASFIWQAVGTTITPKGSVVKAPQSDEEWDELRRHAITLIESSNLLIVPDRLVVHEGEEMAKPQEDANGSGDVLEPAKIQSLIQQDRKSWIKFALALSDTTMESLKMIDAKNAEGLLSVNDRIDTACEGCHKQYWYPEKKVLVNQ